MRIPRTENVRAAVERGLEDVSVFRIADYCRGISSQIYGIRNFPQSVAVLTDLFARDPEALQDMRSIHDISNLIQDEVGEHERVRWVAEQISQQTSDRSVRS